LEEQSLRECINNWDYEDCLTVGKMYKVEVEFINDDKDIMYKFVDDNGEPLQSMINRFK